MKYFILVVLFSVVSALAISEGDIAFVQYQSDGEKTFKFLCLVNIPGGTVVHFTDNGWQADGQFRASEGIITWTAQEDGVPAGTIVALNASMTNSFGPVSKSGSFNLSTSGDQIIAYSGSINFITAINNEGNGWQDDATSSNTSALPTGLSAGTSIALEETDNAIYNGSVLSGDAATVGAAINNPDNWITSNSAPLHFDDLFTMQSLGIELYEFTVKRQNNALLFQWHVSPLSCAAGFNIYALDNKNSPCEKLNSSLIPFSPNQQYYHFQHHSTGHFFELETIFTDGTAERFSTTEISATKVKDENLPNNFKIMPAFPNPFNPRTCVSIFLKDPQHVKIEIVNLLGESIKLICDENFPAGEHCFYWFGKNDQMQMQASGIYFLRGCIGTHYFSQKLTLTK